MRQTLIRPNPFTMMTNPQAILQAMEGSERLNHLQRRICRPLDRPLIPKKGGAADLAAFDHEIDAAEEEAAPLGE
jgi:hypothetical protein